MIEIDGATGGGGVLRTALSLSAITGEPFRIEDVRGARPNPGLRPQHLAAVRTVAALCDADVTGAELGAGALTFRPGTAGERRLSADVGTAGSVALLFDAVLPVAATRDGSVELTATGGTDVKWAPTVDYLRRVKLPLLAARGLSAAVDVRRTGFYPVGGGRATLRTTPSSLSPVVLEDRGGLERVEIHSKAAESLAERRVADRQADRARERLEDAGLRPDVRRVAYVPTDSPGSSLLLRGVYEDALLGVDALGERGRTSEAVAEGAVREFEAAHAGGAPVDRHMADGVMIYLALAGGRVRIPAPTAHVRANLGLLADFGCDVHLDSPADGTPVLSATPLRPTE